MARTSDGYHTLVTCCSKTFIESVRAHADRGGWKSMSAFARAMIAKGIKASIADGTIYNPQGKDAK